MAGALQAIAANQPVLDVLTRSGMTASGTISRLDANRLELQSGEGNFLLGVPLDPVKAVGLASPANEPQDLLHVIEACPDLLPQLDIAAQQAVLAALHLAAERGDWQSAYHGSDRMGNSTTGKLREECLLLKAWALDELGLQTIHHAHRRPPSPPSRK